MQESKIHSYAKQLMGILPAGWKYVRLGDLKNEGIIEEIQDGNHGEKHPKSSDYVPFGVPFIMAKDLIGNRLDLNNCNFIDKKQADNLRVGFSRPGDVLLTHKATMGRVSVVPDGHEYIMLTPQVTYYRIRDRFRLDPYFLKYAFLSPSFQHQLEATSDQSTRKYIGISAQQSLWIPLPPIEEQRAIAYILKILDNKIELNRHMNETLEAMARAIFKSWFVDFDPVHARAEGREPAGMDAEMAALFPDSFEETEFGIVPKGWKVGHLGDVAENPRRGIDPSQIPSVTPYIGLEHMPCKSIALNEWAYSDGLESNKFQFCRGNILFGKLRPYFHKVGVAPIDGVCSTDILVVEPKREYWFAFLLSHVSSDSFIDYTNSASNGTKMPRTNWQDMARYDIVIPSEPIVRVLNSKIMPMIELMLSNISQFRTLSTIRDALLPKLLSGEITAKKTLEIRS